MEAEQVKPLKKGVSDFYSWQLYRWLKKKPRYNKIYEGVWNSFDGYNPERRVLYMGLMDGGCFLGTQLRQLCRHGAKLESWAFCHKEHHVEEWVDVTEDFWRDYNLKGVCAIHGDFAHKWSYVPWTDERICQHCGKIEKRSFVFVPKVIWE